MEKEKQVKIESLAEEIIKLARDSIVVNLRFLDSALLALKPVSMRGLLGIQTDGKNLYYDPVFVLKQYEREPAYVTRVYLHALMHCIFFHSFHYEKLNHVYWNLATDLAIEHMILDMSLSGMSLEMDDELARYLDDYKKEAGKLTAEKLYRNFLLNEPSEGRMEELVRLFHRDEHAIWLEIGEGELEISFAQWQKLTQRIRADLKSFSKDKNSGEALEENLSETMRERYDYAGFLKRFMTMGERIKVNDDEFDYIYYTYGLDVYGNMPLIEPLEYADDSKINEFVIALDTSASCRGKTVQHFLQKTYSIMKTQESFFTKINVHILQSDSDVRADIKITSQDEFDAFMKNGKFVGFGSTDFRPTFRYVDDLIEQGEFENLKGMIYFTDGYGTYPEKMPPYDVAFVFVSEDAFAPPVPSWATKLVLLPEEIDEE